MVISGYQTYRMESLSASRVNTLTTAPVVVPGIMSRRQE
jgi:hypothetical protein